MSHNKERAEKACLNCGAAPLYDRYCHHCGQENVEPRQTLGHLVTHFFNDVTHFDGKFFSTLRLLLFRPGFLSSEYLKGRRMKYLDPIRMYLFISAMFFFVVFALFGEMQNVRTTDYKAIRYMDSIRANEKPLDRGMVFVFINMEGYDQTMSLFDVKPMLKHTIAYYDSVQRVLPDSAKDNFLQRYINRHMIGIYKAYDANPYNFVPNAFNTFIHSFSRIFFISLPLFALYLYLLHLRRRQWYYVSHAIFALHYYSVSFILLLVLAFTNFVPYMTPGVWTALPCLMAIGLLAYLYLAMRRFYQQHWFKTLVKFLVLCVVNSVSMFILIIAMFLHALANTH